MNRWLPGRDRHAERHFASTGALTSTTDQHVVVVGGGVAGLSAALVLAERGVRVTLLERDPQLGGRVAAWQLDDGRTMSRGFHAFFRQYYNLRNILRRADPALERLVPLVDYPLQRPDGLTDSFSTIPKTPPWSVIGFTLTSPTFTWEGLRHVDVRSALELLQVRFPKTFSDYDGESAAAFLDRLRFPEAARDLALEVFARSFFADPDEFSAGELVAMFHTYFMGSAEGLVFDVPDDDYDTALWAPLGRHLGDLGVTIHTGSRVDSLELGAGVTVTTGDGPIEADAVVLAADPRSARHLLRGTDLDPQYLERVANTHNSPPFVVIRLWLDGLVNHDRKAFVGTSGYAGLDNISVLERFEDGAHDWSAEHGGSVVELHAYAADPAVLDDESRRNELRTELLGQMHRIYPETAQLGIVAEEYLTMADCSLITPSVWAERPGVRTPDHRLVLAGDWVRCDYPVALMERAATTGVLAANTLLEGWQVSGEDIWTVPMKGLLAGRR